MSFNVTHIINRFLSVKETEKLGATSSNIRDGGVMAGGESVEVVILQKPVVIDSLLFACDHGDDVQLSVFMTGSRSVLTRLGFIDLHNMRSNQGLTPNRLVLWGSPYFDIIEFDDNYFSASGRYNFSLKKPLYLPRGTRIEILNRNAEEERSYAVAVDLREV